MKISNEKETNSDFYIGCVGSNNRYYIVFNYPFILNREQKELVVLSNTVQNIIAPLDGIDFASGVSYAYLIFSD